MQVPPRVINVCLGSVYRMPFVVTCTSSGPPLRTAMLCGPSFESACTICWSPKATKFYNCSNEPENGTFSHDRSKRAYLTRVQTVAGRSMWQVAVCSCVSTVANTDFNQLQPGNVRIEISASLKLRCRHATVANAGAANCCSFSIVA